jgi:hypothetical protein
MLTVGDFLLSLKFRLRETKDTNWPLEGLIETLNISLAKISRDLLLFKDISDYVAVQGQTFYPLPNHKVRTISVSIDGKIVPYKSFEWIMSNPQEIDPYKIYAYETQDGMTFTQSPTTGTIRIAYNSSRRVDGEDEALGVPDFAQESLMLYCLYLANQRESSDKAFTKSQNYLALYNLEVEKLSSALNKNYRSKNITTDYQVV